MAQYYKSKTFSPIIFLAKKNHLPMQSVAKSLGVTIDTLYKYNNNPMVMTGRQYSILAGIFGIKVETLFYVLIRNKTQIRSKDKKDKWYIESVRTEGDKLIDKMGEFPREDFEDTV